MLVEFSTSIPRTQLRPGYGDGFLGAPLQLRQALENPTPREQGEQRGSSTTPSQQNLEVRLTFEPSRVRRPVGAGV